jgi:glucose-6-phosphate dehydrogenase assembly protein OpcA
MPAAAAVEPEKILKELRELWVQLGKTQDAPGGVLRACAMTLVVAAEADADGRDAESAHRTIGVLMHDHPSRAIVVSPRDGGEFTARVFSECWMPFGSQRQICAEGIEIAADAERTDEVARLLVPLVAPDLPAVLWCRGPRAFRDRSLDPLFPLAHKIIFDTAAVRYGPSAIEFLRRLHKEGRHVADLAWTRLTGWREAVAHVFSHDTADVTGARVHYCGDRPATSCLYFARWIERALPGLNVLLEPAREGHPEAVGMCAVTFTQPGGEISIHVKEPGSLEVQMGQTSFASPLPGISEEALMREELSILGPDPVFDNVLT